MKCILDDKDFQYIKSDPLEIYKIDKEDYTLFYHEGDKVYECWTFTKEELKKLWIMLSEK